MGICSMGHGNLHSLGKEPHAGEGPAGVWEDEEPRALLWVLRIHDPALPGARWCCRTSRAAAREGSKPRGNPPPPVCRGEGGNSRLQSPPHPPVLRNGPVGILPGTAGSGSAAPAPLPSPALLQQPGPPWAPVTPAGPPVPPEPGRAGNAPSQPDECEPLLCIWKLNGSFKYRWSPRTAWAGAQQGPCQELFGTEGAQPQRPLVQCPPGAPEPSLVTAGVALVPRCRRPGADRLQIRGRAGAGSRAPGLEQFALGLEHC